MPSGRKRVISHNYDSICKSHKHSTMVVWLTDFMEGSVKVFSDSRACVPLTKIRGLFESAIRCMMHILKNQSSNENNLMNIGIWLCTDPSNRGSTYSICFGHFHWIYIGGLGLLVDEVGVRLKPRCNWCSIIYGSHDHVAILKLINSQREWGVFQWYVNLIKIGHRVDRYKQLAQIQSQRNHHSYNI